MRAFAYAYFRTPFSRKKKQKTPLLCRAVSTPESRVYREEGSGAFLIFVTITNSFYIHMVNLNEDENPPLHAVSVHTEDTL